MRKLFSLIAAVVVSFFTIGQAWGESKVFTFNTDAGLSALGITKPAASSGTELGDDTYTLDPISLSATSGSTATRVWNSSGNTDLRIYSGGAFTLSVSGTNKITSIVLAGSAVNGFSYSGTDGSWSNGTWTAGSAKTATTVVLTATATGKINTITVTYETASICTSEVNITKGAETNGTYTLSNAKVCADGEGGTVSVSEIEPAEGYRFKEITTSASGTVDNANKEVTGIKAATTITVVFEEIPVYTVTWNNNGDESVKTSVEEGSKPIFPSTPGACDATSNTFIGWAIEAWDGKVANLTGKTVYTSAAELPAVSANVTYYAVFAKVSGGTAGWELTAIGDLTSTDVFVLADADNYALTNDNGTSNPPAATAIDVAEGKITSTVTDKLKWNISGNATDGYTFYPNGDDESWLYCSTTAASSNNNNMRVGTGTRKVFVVDNNGYLVTNDTYTDRYLSRYNTQDFRGYTSNTTNPVVPKCYKYVSGGSAEDYMTTCAMASVAAPTFTPAAGEYIGTQSVTLECATEGASIYYTTNGDAPTSSSTLYTTAISVTETTTIKAVAVKEGMADSGVSSATYTIHQPLTTMDEIFAAAGSSSTNVYVTFDNWVVSGVNKYGNNAFVTDGTKGLIIYENNNGFQAGDILSGTAACKLVKYLGSAELTQLTATTEGLSVTTGGVVTPIVLDAAGITALSGVNTGSVITISGTYVGGKSSSVAGVKLYDAIYSYSNLTEGQTYTITGVYQQYNDTKEIMPRSAADIVEGTPTAIDNAAVEGKAVKFIENGQLFIEKAGVRYNVMGQIIK